MISSRKEKKSTDRPNILAATWILQCVLLITVATAACVGPRTDHAATTDSKSFTITIPNRAAPTTVHDGPFPETPNTYYLAAVSNDENAQYTVLVFPTLENAKTLDTMVPGWERGYLKKASRKVSSRRTTLANQEAHEVIGELDLENEEIYTIRTILIMHEGTNYAIGAVFPKGHAQEYSIEEFIHSFKILR